MKADDARRLVEEARSTSTRAAEVMLTCWHLAIRKAAEAGRTSVTEDDIDRPRMVIPATAKQAAINRLRADGFTIETVETGPNEYATRASW